MTFVSSIKLWDADKLRVLQRLDKYRQWHSLEEKRYCLVCGHVITGRTIFVIGGSRGNGPVRIICPTPNCHSIPMDWVLPPDEVLQNLGKSPEFPEYLAPRRNRGGHKDTSGSRLRRLATRLSRHTSTK